MPYPDNFSGSRFDAHYGTDEEPSAEYLAWLKRRHERIKRESEEAEARKLAGRDPAP